MSQHDQGLSQFHWLIEVLQTVDVGVLVLDLDYKITAWNGFMENNSGIDSADALGQSLFDVFREVSVDWFKHKAETVVQLRNRAFTTWEQRPYVFKFRNNRPITGVSEFMYQNCTFIPISNTTGQIDHLAVIVYDVSDIASSKMELKAANIKLAELSRTDGLTGLYNRGFWESQFRGEFLRQLRKPRPISLIMFDIDHFKQVNDQYGHPAGDEVIRRVAQAVRENSRVTDLSGRYGGEEFALMLLDSDQDSSYQFAERLRTAVESLQIETDAGIIQVSISIGLATWQSSYQDYGEWIEAADKALYQAKENGRNNTVVSN